MPVPAISFNSVVALADQFPVLAGLDLTVQQGECVMLAGPNGSGKTSFLRVVAGLIPVASGTAEVFGFDVERDRRPLARSVGYLGHNSGLYSDLTIRENVAFFGRKSTSADAVTQSLEALGLGYRLQDVQVAKVSAGQRRRAALACLLVRNRPLWLLDEPYSGLDTDTRFLLDTLISTATANGTTVVFSSHEAHETVAHRRVNMVGGTTAIDLVAEDEHVS